MASPQELSDFLSSVEQRAFKQAVYAVRDDDAALDIVQDAMIKLAEKYGDRPASELPLVFTRILQNRIHDWFRRQKVRNTWVTLFSNMGKKTDENDDLDENDDFDPLESLSAPDDSEIHQDGAFKLERTQLLESLESEISKLPARQREAFLMRYWDELSITETALAMSCSEGSVKTHCSRATQALAKALKLKGITL
ncbi:MAG: hypothetical protein RL234_1549 [Pseudomonadota bacterium]